MAAAASASEAPALPKASGEELVCAAAAGELGLVESLLALGAPAGHRARKAGEEASGHDVGDSPLVAAAKGGHEALVPLLCAAGADPNAAAEKGSALPLWWATRFGYYGVMSALLEAGADVDGVSSGRGRPLALAAGLGDADALRLLLAADADADADMGAALRRAAGGKDNAAECCRVLVDIGGARVAVTEGTVESAAAVAEKAGDPAVHAYLERVALRQAVDGAMEASAARLAAARAGIDSEAARRRDEAAAALRPAKSGAVDAVAKLRAETESLRARFARK